MRAHASYDYAMIRVVPRVERDGIRQRGRDRVVPGRRFLEARIELDERGCSRSHPTSISTRCARISRRFPHLRRRPAAGPIGKLSPRERFHWLVAPRSTIIQTSPVHTGRCTDPIAAMEHLLESMVRTPRAAPPRQ